MIMTNKLSLEHTNSYYAATQRDKEPFPTLEQDISADICIVGGGLTGVAAAVELAERKYDVVLLEANRIGWGASGRNGGQIIGGYNERMLSNPKNLDQQYGEGASKSFGKMSTECVDIIRERTTKYQIECDLKWGFLDVALKRREMKDLKEYCNELKDGGYPHEVRMIDADEVKNYLGTDRYIGGRINEGFGHLHVLDLCKGEARVAENLGARIYEQSPATAIDGGSPLTVRSATGSVRAKHIVLCGNAHLATIAPDLAPKLTPYVMPATSYIIATEPLSDDLAKEVMPINYAVCDQRTALDYYRLTADNRMLFGGLSNYTAKPPSSIRETMRLKMVKVFPQLAEARIDYAWGGTMGISLKRIQQMGQLQPNVFYAQAYSGHGVAPDTHDWAAFLPRRLKDSRIDLICWRM